ncbi:MAG TPA: DUF2935 domain-containing protein [Clostridiaceae bacterium]|nr:DUF2935 domain-containing protein [Clostridiaceae bacterium]
MQFYYGEKNLLRALDETEFWKHQEAEHTVVIRQIEPNLEQMFVMQLQQYELSFNQAKGNTVKYIETLARSRGNISRSMLQELVRFLEKAIDQSKQFIILLDQILSESNAVKNNPVAPVVINHIRRESEYFIGIMQAVLDYANRSY